MNNIPVSQHFEYKGLLYIIPYLPYECDDVYYQRAWFVVKQQPNNEKEFNEAIYLSKLWCNIKYLDCTYDDDIMNKIKKLEDNI